jgi:hypothetical protein
MLDLMGEYDYDISTYGGNRATGGFDIPGEDEP